MLELVAAEVGWRRQPVYLSRLDDGWNWEAAVPFWHGLLVAADASDVDDLTVGKFASSAIASGCAWVATWGTDCERVHDLFDSAYLAAAAGGQPSSIFLISASEPGVSLAEALWNALNTWAPSDPHPATGADHPPLIAYVQEPWLFEARRLLRDPDELDRLVLPT